MLFFDPIVEEQKGEGEGSDKADRSDCWRGLSGGSAGGSFILHEHHQNQNQNQSSKWQPFWGGVRSAGNPQRRSECCLTSLFAIICFQLLH